MAPVDLDLARGDPLRARAHPELEDQLLALEDRRALPGKWMRFERRPVGGLDRRCNSGHLLSVDLTEVVGRLRRAVDAAVAIDNDRRLAVPFWADPAAHLDSEERTG